MAPEHAWGRVAIAGGTDWPSLGRKGAPKTPGRDDLLAPHLLRSIINIGFKHVFAGHSACHAVLIDVEDRACNRSQREASPFNSLGLPLMLSGRHQLGCDEKALWEPTLLTDTTQFPNVPDALRHAKIVHAACGRHHTILVTADGEAYAAGANPLGQCAQPQDDVATFSKVKGAIANEKVIQASCGISFTLLLTASGRVYAFGSHQNGQLGQGRTGESIRASKIVYQDEREPLLIDRNLADKKVVQISSGQTHSLALTEDGYVYSWGSGAVGRLGHGEQKDELYPRIIDVFTSPVRTLRAAKIVCGSTNSMAVGGQGMLYLWGKFKNTGDGSTGQPWMSPRPVSDITAMKIHLLSAGGVTLFAASKIDPMVIAMGQNAINGELGLGVGSAKSATSFREVETLHDLDVIDIAAGQNTTFFLIRPPHVGGGPDVAVPVAPEPKPAGASFDSGWGFASPAPPAATPPVEAVDQADGSATLDNESTDASSSKRTAWDSIPRFPPIVDPPDDCSVCHQDKGEGVPLIECMKCEVGTHVSCMNPPLDKEPDDDWYCDSCQHSLCLPPADETKKKAPKKNPKKREASDSQSEPEDDVVPKKKKR